VSVSNFVVVIVTCSYLFVRTSLNINIRQNYHLKEFDKCYPSKHDIRLHFKYENPQMKDQFEVKPQSTHRLPSADKTAENLTCCRKFLCAENFVR
jgi:hypothetical protein